MADTNRVIKEIGKEALERMYETMLIARKFEEEVQRLFDQGQCHGTAHLAVGEEATAVGTMFAVEPRDYMLATHRGHQQAIAKGMDVNAMMAEILGKAAGICKGKGGSMHMADLDKGVLGANGILGSNAPIACGAGITIRRRQEDRIVVCFFGDGASNLGAVHEAMNLAAVWDLPALFVLVNNTYGMSTHISRASRDVDLSKRAIPFGMPAETVDGNDVTAVYRAVKQARDYVAAEGPMLIVENTYRISGHSKSDQNLYRGAEEIELWRTRCPILRLKNGLLESGCFTEAQLETLDQKTTAIIQEAVAYARNAPEPSLDAILEDVYA